MKKILFAIFTISIIFASCSSGSSDSDSNSIPINPTNPINTPQSTTQQGNEETKSSETTNNFTNKDTSTEKNSFFPALMPELSWEYDCLKNTSTKANEDSNKGLDYSDGKSMYGCGFEGKIKFNNQVKYAGFQLFKKNSAKKDRFDFIINEDSSFEMKSRINEVSKSIFKVKNTESHLDAKNFNIIKVKTTDSGNVEIYLNGYFTKKLSSSEMNFPLTDVDKITFCYGTKSTVTASKPAEIWAKILNLQNKK